MGIVGTAATGNVAATHVDPTPPCDEYWEKHCDDGCKEIIQGGTGAPAKCGCNCGGYPNLWPF
jgi:hypothetical protein